MSRLIFILGHPGVGKSSALRNLKTEDVNYITASGKELPFTPEFKPITEKSIEGIKNLVGKATKPIVVIDDFNFALAKEVSQGSKDVEAKRKGGDTKATNWDVYRKIGVDFYDFIESISSKDTDQNIYLMGHIEHDQERVTLRTVGKAISTGATPPEGFTNIVLEAVVDPLDGFVFRTKTDGSGVKSPNFGEKPMFDGDTVENDLKVVDSKIRNYFKKGKK